MNDKYKVYEAELSEFKPDPKNHNKHTLRGHKMVTNSMQNRGYARPGFAANDGTVLGGNLSTMEIAPSLGLGNGKVLVVETDGDIPIIHKRRNVAPDSVEARQLSYEDNFTSVFSFALDPAIVMADIEAGFNFEAIDISLPDLGAMLEGAARELLRGNGQPPEPEAPPIDRAEELQAKWQVKTGDIWQMGQHFIICGDCREPETWQRLLDAAGLEKVNGVFTSPPYAEQRKAQYGGVPTAEYVQWWGAVQTNVRAALAGDGSFFVNIKPHTENKERSLYVFDLVCAMVRAYGWKFHDDFIWTHGGTPGDAEMMHRFKNCHEPVYWFSLGDFKFNPQQVMHWSSGAVIKSPKNPGLERIQGQSGGALVGAVVGKGMAFPGNVLSIGKNNDNSITGGHPAAFPVALPTFFLKAYSDPGDSWVDPFCGSGTTIVACQNEGRIGLGIERLEKYCAVILERLATTGIEPRLLSTDSTL